MEDIDRMVSAFLKRRFACQRRGSCPRYTLVVLGFGGKSFATTPGKDYRVSFALADPRGPSSKLPNLRLCLDPSVDFASDIVVWGSQRYRITAVPGNTTGYCLGLLYIEMRIR